MTAKLPAGTHSYETRHDPVAGGVEEGTSVRFTITVDMAECEIVEA